MAYSRWSHSRWYTYWVTQSETAMQYKLPSHKLKRNQVFEICDLDYYFVSYGDIEDYGMKSILKRIKKFYSKSFEVEVPMGNKKGEYIGSEFVAQKNPPTVEELNELAGYIREFVEDVDAHFEFKNFFYYEWWLPFRNKYLRNKRK